MTSPDDVRRRTDDSRARLAALDELRQQNALLVQRSRRRLEASRALLDRCSPAERL